MEHPIWTVMEHQGRTLAWLARRIGYSHSHVKNVRSGGAIATANFRERCAQALDLPENVLFFDSRRTDGAPASQPNQATLVPSKASVA